MPIRKTPFATPEIYHLLNRGVARAPIFTNKRSYKRFIETIDFYRFANIPLRLSYFLVLSLDDRQRMRSDLEKQNQKLVEILCYCLMPNHFHIVAKQLMDGGISMFIRKTCDSYTKYFNLKNDRVGPLMQGNFKAIRVETDEQLIHLSRYVHINPYIGNVVQRKELLVYPFSSLPAYLSTEDFVFLNKDLVIGHFPSAREYKRFVLNQADYKKSQLHINHLMLE